jgi:predicted transcriptional regulator
MSSLLICPQKRYKMLVPKAGLGSTEIEVLRYLGDQAPLCVGDVADHFAKTSGQARTTVLTIMERLRKKGYLTRKRIQGVYHYSPKISKHELLQGLVKTFVHTTLAGSVSPFVAYLSEGGPVSEQDLEQLKQLVSDLEHDRKAGGK